MSKIGIFVKKHDSVFTNGCVQQAYFTFKSIRKAGYDVDFLTTDSSYDKFNLEGEKVIYICDKIDILKDYHTVIFSSLIVHQYSVLNIIKFYGIKIVHLIVGNYYILNCEEFVFGVHNRVMERLCNEFVDEIWLMPMYTHAIDYINAITKKPVKICPYVWDSTIIDNYISIKSIKPQYREFNTNKFSVLLMEPNMSIHKNALPLLCALNNYFLEYPDRIDLIHMLCKPEHDSDPLNCVKHLDIVRANKVRIYERVISIEIFNQMNDRDMKYCVLSTNIRNGLNFIHLECMHLGIPIIHNCLSFKGNGLYYEDSDNTIDFKTIIKLLNIIYDNDYTPNSSNTKTIIDKYYPEDNKNTQGYLHLLKDLECNYKKPSIEDFIKMETIWSYDDPLYKTGIIIPIYSNYDINIITKNLEYIAKYNIEILFYINNKLYNDFKSVIDKINIKLNNKLVYKICSINNENVDFFAISNNDFNKVIFMRQSIICGIDLNEIINFVDSDNSISGFNLENDIFESKKIQHYFEQIYNYIGIKTKNTNAILDYNIFCYKNTNNIRNIFSNYLENIEYLSKFIENDFIIQLLFILSNYNIKIIDSNQGLIFNEYSDPELFIGYFMKNKNDINMLYMNIDTGTDKEIDVDKFLFQDYRASYHYTVKNKVFRNIIEND